MLGFVCCVGSRTTKFAIIGMCTKSTPIPASADNTSIEMETHATGKKVAGEVSANKRESLKQRLTEEIIISTSNPNKINE